MAAGLPVVAARATGSQSLVEEGVTGQLIRPGAVAAFADALQRYCESDDTRAAAGIAGRAASARYGWDEVNQVLVDAYLRIMRQRAGGGRPPVRQPVP